MLKKFSNRQTLRLLKNHLDKHWVLYASTLLLVLLLFKNPFSGQNTISSLEPFPDASIYLNLAKNITEGNGFKISYKQFTLDSTIPPLYSITLVPFYAIFKDPRSFYFANVFFALTSAFFFYKITSRLFKSRLVIFLLQFTFTTNSIVFTYPAFAMSENLLICLFIISIYLLTGSLSTKKSVILGVLTIAFVATKYVAWTLSLSLLITYLALILKKNNQTPKLTYMLNYSFFTVVSFFIFLLIESSGKQQSLSAQLRFYIQPLVDFIFAVQLNVPANSTPANSHFSASYINTNLLKYFAGIIGGVAPTAGKDLTIIPIFVGMSSLVGVFINPFISKFKLLSFYFLLVFTTTLSFIIFFFAADARYLFIIIPLQILTFGILLNTLLNFLKSRKLTLSYFLVVLISFTAIIINTYPSFKNQLASNFFLPDYSPSYETVVFFNQNFKNKSSQQPLIISILPPVMIDFYSNHNYNLLPFSPYQNFMAQPQIWNLPENPDLFKLYNEYLKQNQEIYMSDYLTSSHYHSPILSLYKENFTLIEISSGCHNRCKLFQLKLKSSH